MKKGKNKNRFRLERIKIGESKDVKGIKKDLSLEEKIRLALQKTND